MSERVVACPACRGDAVFGPSNPWRPFCCQRCRNVDLGAWANEDYRVAASPEPDDEAPSAAAAPSASRPPAH